MSNDRNAAAAHSTSPHTVVRSRHSALGRIDGAAAVEATPCPSASCRAAVRPSRQGRRRTPLALVHPGRKAIAAVGAGVISLSAAAAIPALAIGRTGGTDLATVTAATASTITAGTGTGGSAPETAAVVDAASPHAAGPQERFAAEASHWTAEQRAAFARWTETPEARAAREAAEAPVTTSTTSAPPTTAAPAPTYASGGFLDCVRHRESRGQYGAVNGSSGAGGAYQFMPQTWNNTAAYAGRPDLIGVNPAYASPADQDAMAQALLAWQGAAPWGGGC